MYYILFLFFTAALWGDEKPLRVGMELSYPPFETVDERGEPRGFSVDLAKELAQYLHRQLVIENISYVGLIPALKNGQIDLIISSMSATEERKNSIDFSDPYLAVNLALLVNRHSSVRSAADLNQKGRKVVVKIGTTGYHYAEKHFPLAEIILLDKESGAVMEVVQGKADAFLYDQFSVYTHWKKNPKETRALFVPLQTEYWSIGIRKGNHELKEKVNAFLKQFQKERLKKSYHL